MFLTERMELERFSTNERIVIDYLLANGSDIAPKTTSQIAQETFVAKSTLVRIAQKLNFKGWSDFKTAFLEEINYLNKQDGQVDANYPFTSQDNIREIAQNLADLKKSAIEDTLSLMNYKDLQAAIQLIHQAPTTHFFAVSNNLLLAEEFAHNMARIQKDVRVHQLQGEIAFKAYLAQEQSCAVLLSYSGGTSILVQIAEILKQKRIPIILITSLGDNQLTNYAQVSLRLTTREKLYSKIATFSTDAAITYLLDVIYSGVFAKNYDHNLTLRRTSSKTIEFERTASSNIIRENDN